jgi:DNA mismatch endonuclease (patch repair protein)
MTDVFTGDQRSHIMSRIRSRGNQTTELRFIGLLKKNKIIGWRRGSSLPGKPDFVFRRQRLAVFIDGDFWHGNPRRFRLPKSNLDYWGPKIEGNRRRDAANTRRLKELGWRVLRIWESALRKETVVSSRLKRALCHPNCHSTIERRNLK